VILLVKRGGVRRADQPFTPPENPVMTDLWRKKKAMRIGRTVMMSPAKMTGQSEEYCPTNE
jgi:hypothetical protein